MRKLAFAVLFGAIAVAALAAMTRPPVEKLVEGQQQCNNGTAICMGDKNHKVRLQGQVYLDSYGGVANSIQADGGFNAATANVLSARTKGMLVYDFPALSPVLPCFRSDFLSGAGGTATIANCPFGSSLTVGVDQVMNSTLCSPPTAVLTATNTAAVQQCVMAFDGGACNMPDASYIITCTP
jgi:hypothetical protein